MNYYPNRTTRWISTNDLLCKKMATRLWKRNIIESHEAETMLRQAMFAESGVNMS